MTGKAPVQWVDNCLEGSTQTSHQQLCQIISGQGSASVSLGSATINILFKNCSDGVENMLVKK